MVGDWFVSQKPSQPSASSMQPEAWDCLETLQSPRLCSRMGVQPTVFSSAVCMVCASTLGNVLLLVCYFRLTSGCQNSVGSSQDLFQARFLCPTKFVASNLQRDFGWSHAGRSQVIWAVDSKSVFCTCEVSKRCRAQTIEQLPGKSIHPSASHGPGCREGVCSALPALHIRLLCSCHESLGGMLLEWK